MKSSSRNVTTALAAVCLATASVLASTQIGDVHAQDNSSACAAACITEYSLPPVPDAQPGVNEPFGITAGSGGAVWFSHGGAIGRLALSGTVTEYPIPTPASGSGWVGVGSDRAIWFAERTSNKIGRVSVSGAVTEYTIPGASTSPTCPPGPSSTPQAVAAGPDGAVWFTEECGNRIGRLAPSGQISEYTVPTPDSHPLGMTAGPDGALWFVEKAAEKIGRITTSGRITEFKLSSGTLPQRITVGADGALWFSEARANKIGRLTTDGAYTEYPAPGLPVGITAGPDGALWFVEFNANKIGRMSLSGQVTDEYPIPTAESGALQIAVGPDAALWFTEPSVDQLGRLQIPGAHAATSLARSSGTGLTASFTVSFSSTVPGQGEVYFGPGPGCSGLVEAATTDVHAGTLKHTVVVTGNDMPGTIGDNGIVPGATYWYETVTVTAAAVVIDDNGGKCSSVTISRS
jgi:virginiamycin B lyase